MGLISIARHADQASGAAPESAKGRHSPAKCTGIIKQRVDLRTIEHAMAPHRTYDNFVCILNTLRTSPAMGAGVIDRLWKSAIFADVFEAWEAIN